MRKLTLILAAAALAAGPAQAAKAPKDPLKVQSAPAFKGAQDFVIGSFTVGFLMERTDSARAGGGLLGGGGGGRSTARSYLEGIGQADLQAITDAAYEDFKAQLAARNYTVAPSAELRSSTQFAKAKPMAAPHQASIMFDGDSKAKATYFAPTELGQLYLFPGDVTATGLSGMGAAMAAGGAQMGAAMYAKAAGRGVVNILYLVDFADSDKYGGWFRMSSAVKVKAGLAIAPVSSRLTYFAPSGKTGSVALKDPVAIGGDFAEVTDSTGKTAKTMETIGNVIGMLGGIGTNKSRKYSFTAKPDLYRAAAIDAAKQTNTRLIDRMAALR